MPTTDLLYLEFDFTVNPVAPWTDILASELGSIGFESFEETDRGLLAYVQKEQLDEAVLQNLDVMQRDDVDIAFAKAEVPPTNWNAEWEKNFEPLTIAGKCHVRAPFHPKSGCKYDIVIAPKMSFGTGHHPTTHLMAEYLLEEEMEGLQVLDMGSGTGLLAILACKRGAAAADAIDYDRWCYENALENVALNNLTNIEVIHGDAARLGDKGYDLIIANINRNILLQDLPIYSSVLRAGSPLFLSGFYDEDLVVITEACKSNGLTYQSHKTRKNWISAKFTKTG